MGGGVISVTFTVAWLLVLDRLVRISQKLLIASDFQKQSLEFSEWDEKQQTILPAKGLHDETP